VAKAKAAKKSKSKGSMAVSFNPDALVQGGLADDFDGEITRAVFGPWDYDGNMDHYELFVRLEITPDEDSDIQDTVVEHYSVGKDALDHFHPSVDGIEPVDLEEWDQEDSSEVEGPYIVRVGKRESLFNNTNWAHFVVTAVDAGFPKEDVSLDLGCFEGVHAHFNRLPQKKRPGLSDDGKQRTILLITELLEQEEKAKTKSATKKGKGKAAKVKSKAKDEDEEEEEEEEEVDEEEDAEEDEDEEDSLDAALVAILVEALNSEKDGTMAKRKILTTVVKNIDKAQKGAAMRRAAQEDFLSGRDEWVYDDEDGSISLVE
jgi:hypothetical protein